MRAFVRFTLAQHVLLNLVFAGLMAAGAYALLTSPVERYPAVNFGKVFISTYYPGASPQDVEALVTRKIEDAIEDVENVEFVRAASFRERSQVVVKFVDDSDYEALYDELRFKVLSVLKDLPEQADPPRFNMITVDDWLPVVSVNLAGDRANRALTLMAKEMKVPLSLIPGVKEVKLQGEYAREFHVTLDPERMASRGVTFDQAAAALQDANRHIPAGDFTDPSGEFVVRVDQRFRDREQVVRTVIRRDADGSLVTVADVIADARLAYRDPHVVASVNGRDCVTLQVIKTPESNALDIAREVDRVVEEFRPVLAREGVDPVLTQDSTTYIRDSMDTLGWNLVVGVLLVSLVIWYFMGVRNAGLIVVGIPFSFLTTMVVMHATGNSLNEITLFSFVLVSGIIVDDAIVVVENIFRHAQEGKPLREAVVDGAAEVIVPVISATATTVAAFLPMLIMTGSTGEFFALVPKAVSFALAASLFECMFLAPIHFLDWGPRNGAAIRREETGENAGMRAARAVADRLVRFTTRHRVGSSVAVMLAFFAALAAMVLSLTGQARLIPIQFFPDDYRLYYVTLEGPAATPISEVSDRLKAVSRMVMEDGPGMARTAQGYAGFYVNEDYEEIFGHNVGTVIVTLPTADLQRFADYPANDPQAHLESMTRRIAERFAVDGFTVKVRPEKDGPPAGKDVNVRVVGADTASVDALAAELMAFIRGAPDLGPHLEQLEDDRGRPHRVFRMEVRERKAAEMGVTAGQAAALAGAVLDGRYLGKYRAEDEEIDLKLTVARASLAAPQDALRTPVLEHPAGPVRLADVVAPSLYAEPGQLNRYEGQRSITITANLKPGAPASTPTVVRAIQDHYQTVRSRFPGAGIAFGGEFEDTRRSYTSLAYAFGISVLLIFAILATQFQSYLQPAIILSSIVFSVIGIVFGKLLTQTLFTINSFIATVGVAGVVVNDAIVLVDFINARYRAGATRREAVLDAVRVRLRPILLTTLTTVLGLLPMAVGFPRYSLVWGAMASTFVTGLVTATVLNICVVPVQWELLMGLKERLARRRERRAAERPPAA
ncbi:MAG: efflux RND transporter permease subunit [Thermodesulfobacteriota bacterium]